MWPISFLLALLALVFLLASVTGRVPLWPSVLCLVLLALLQAGGVR